MNWERDARFLAALLGDDETFAWVFFGWLGMGAFGALVFCLVHWLLYKRKG